MQIKPSIRSNIFTNSHPLGCEAYIHRTKFAGSPGGGLGITQTLDITQS